MLLLAMLLSCSDIGINEIKKPSIIVAPELLDFGHLESGHESDVRRITITNGGTADLVVERVAAVGDNYSVDESGFVVPAGGWYQIEVSYSPVTFEHNEGHVDIYLEGDNQPSANVWLDGYGDAPVINITPPDHDFGDPLLGCDTTQEITIQNDGNIDLEISNISIMASIPPEITIDFGTLPEFPWVIPPNGRIDFFANYAPMDEIDDLTNLEVESSDPATPVYAAYAEGSAVMSNEKIQNWIQDSKLIVDIVWIIDNSGSMYPFQMLLAQNIEAFMNIFLGYTPDFRMMFITTDSSEIYGNIIDGSSTDPVAEAASIINSIGITGSGWEKGLQHFHECVAVGGECNSFLRPNAALVAIFVSDEPDHSVTTLSSLISMVDYLKPGMFTPYAIIGDVPAGCTSSGGWNPQAGWGYWDLVDYYASSWWSICDSDWGTQMQEIAESVSIKTKFYLDEEDPHVETIRVWINGQLIEEGWEYDEEENAVIFSIDFAPQSGDSVDIGYSTWGCGE